MQWRLTSNNLLTALLKAKQYQYDYGFGTVAYVDKSNHTTVTDFFKENQQVFDSDAIYFLKDGSYANQHEWRYMLDRVPVECKNSHQSIFYNWQYCGSTTFYFLGKMRSPVQIWLAAPTRTNRFGFYI